MGTRHSSFVEERPYGFDLLGFLLQIIYEKPIEIEVLKLGVGRAFRLHEIERENRKLAQKTTGHNIPGFVTNNPVTLTASRLTPLEWPPRARAGH
ncbi:MAG: hypothetical protein ACE5JI_17750 [Acidobacteriota bacterium]